MLAEEVAPASSLTVISLAAEIAEYWPPLLFTTRQADSEPSLANAQRSGVATSPAFSSAFGADASVRSVSKPNEDDSKGIVVYRSFLTCDQTTLSPPSSVGA